MVKWIASSFRVIRASTLPGLPSVPFLPIQLHHLGAGYYMCNGETAGYSGGACTGCVTQGSSESEEGGVMQMGVLTSCVGRQAEVRGGACNRACVRAHGRQGRL